MAIIQQKKQQSQQQAYIYKQYDLLYVYIPWGREQKRGQTGKGDVGKQYTQNIQIPWRYMKALKNKSYKQDFFLFPISKATIKQQLQIYKNLIVDNIVKCLITNAVYTLFNNFFDSTNESKQFLEKQIITKHNQ
eukprot:TRINITY_DN7799_c1_g1_i1.p5 TRINITY_DN7799_c1_g1~~TRINITY_DN7799_c1_g1_i1.p5  ORF type:complete len:134 (+),score=1.00 TRINITY_DN7799_c1_g1_i1:1484-1885(+)